jgi:hypothetical protein
MQVLVGAIRCEDGLGGRLEQGLTRPRLPTPLSLRLFHH